MSLLREFEQLWNGKEDRQQAPDIVAFLNQQVAADGDSVLNVLRLDQHRRWQTDSPLKVEDYLKQLPSLPSGIDWRLQLVIGEFEARQNTDRPLSAEEVSSRFPDLSETLRERIRQVEVQSQAPAATPHDSGVTELVEVASGTVTYITSKSVGVRQKGRYRLDRVLGEGGFGRVYLGYDDELRRQVAIKVPTKKRFQKPEDAEIYLSEARTVAGLDHPHIVPVYDMGRTDDGSVYVISRFINGCTLEDRIKGGGLSDRKTAELIATVATALQCAHQRRLIHRDVKPANILIEDRTNTPFVADFGLAVREEDYLQQNALAGTPAYMSPEQARGEGHRLDGRSDVFALGVVLYECLTGKKPFRGNSPREIVDQVISSDPRPPRHLKDTIAPELERICLKALSKRASDRYATAADMAEDLQAWLAPHPTEQTTAKPTTIVPRGLRSFGPDDADFFLDLLPGPRNREGLPESIAFWKQRIEETDPDETFSVGLIYGPSGCGKSSLVKAGLLPHLSPDVVAVYVEATPDETETRILRGLRKRLPDLPEDLSPVDTLAFLRRGAGFQPARSNTTESPAGWKPAPRKVAIIIDQFEQWLHAHREDRAAELVAALRQCDGGRLQAVVMVRDDFAMAAARFMDLIDVPILQGHNFATVDLFDGEHAEKVLVKFGQAFGKLPAQSGKLTEEAQSFVRRAASGLAQNGKVVSVRLALFSEMVKGKLWVSQTLEEVGGTAGIGVSFLEENFTSRIANPKHRLHQTAAREVLKSLLPEVGSDIRGHMRSHSELLLVSGYQQRPREFNDLLRVLDGELRLITPTDPEGAQTESGGDLRSKYYQLTHDYLVTSLREWLTRKQQETRRGRAELKLKERSALWQAKGDNRYLPSALEWVRIRFFTDRAKWTEAQSKMMRRAQRSHVTVWGTVLAVVLIIGVTVRWYASSVKARADADRARFAVSSLATATGPAVPFALRDLIEIPAELARVELETQFADAIGQRRLSLAYGLARLGRPAVAEVLEGLTDAKTQPEEMANVVTALTPQKHAAIRALQQAAFQQDDSENWRLKSRCAIAALHLGDVAIAEQMLQAFPDDGAMATRITNWDPIQRTVFISEFQTWSGGLTNLSKILPSISDAELRSGLCLALGGAALPQNEPEKSEIVELVSSWWTSSRDSGTHNAAFWSLQRWSADVPAIQPEAAPPKDRNWWHVGRGVRLVKIEPRPLSLTGLELKVDRAFWISDCEITLRQFHRFIEDDSYPGLRPVDWPGTILRGDVSAEQQQFHPAQRVNWYDALMFCNWLSMQHGLLPSYILKPAEITADGDHTYHVEVVPAGNGYRLPTGDEWRYACLAFTTTSYSFGEDPDFLLGYGSCERNSKGRGTSPVRSFRCSGLGLFDMHGNVAEWCWEACDDEPSRRYARGGSWFQIALHCGSFLESRLTPTYRHSRLGFRVLRYAD